MIVSLSEFTPANGATHVVPQSNHFDHYPDPTKPHASIQAAMPAGSALFVLGTTFHGGGANKTTDEIRHGITMAYVSHWVRPQESFLLSVSQERAAAFPRQLQELMGYKIGKKRLGRIYAGKEHKFTGPLSKLVALDWESDGDTDSQYRPKEGNPAEVKAKI